MMNARTLVLVLLALGATSSALAQQPVQLKFSRVVDLTIPIESNMPGIPGIKTYADNPSKVDVVTAINGSAERAVADRRDDVERQYRSQRSGDDLGAVHPGP